MSLSQSESTILHESIKFQNDYFEPLIENEYLIVLDLNWHIKLLYYNFLWQILFCTRFTILTHLTIIRAPPPPFSSYTFWNYFYQCILDICSQNMKIFAGNCTISSHENQTVLSLKIWFWENWPQSLKPYFLCLSDLYKKNCHAVTF